MLLHPVHTAWHCAHFAISAACAIAYGNFWDSMCKCDFHIMLAAQTTYCLESGSSGISTDSVIRTADQLLSDLFDRCIRTCSHSGSTVDLQYFRSALLANSSLSAVSCDLGKLQRITAQSMPLINHISCCRCSGAVVGKHTGSAGLPGHWRCVASQHIQPPVINARPPACRRTLSCWSAACF